MSNYYILVDGVPKLVEDAQVWGKWMEREGGMHRQICDNNPIPGIRVSTVFLGIDHNWSDTGPPLVFETLVFNGPLDGEMFRYSTMEEAKVGHTIMVNRVLDAGKAPQET